MAGCELVIRVNVEHLVIYIVLSVMWVGIIGGLIVSTIREQERAKDHPDRWLDVAKAVADPPDEP